IVDKSLWANVQERIAERRDALRSVCVSGKLPRSENSPRARHLLAGFLACEECGGAFCALQRGGVFGCSRQRNRGPGACGNGLRVRARDLEARVLGAIQSQVLAPEAAAYVAERTMGLVRERREAGDLDAKRRRLAEVAGEINRLVALAARVDGIDEIAR